MNANDTSDANWRFCPKTHPQIESVRAFDDNYPWLIWSLSRSEALVVDPGDAAPVTARLKARNASLAGILVTHHHLETVPSMIGVGRQTNPFLRPSVCRCTQNRRHLKHCR